MQSIKAKERTKSAGIMSLAVSCLFFLETLRNGKEIFCNVRPCAPVTDVMPLGIMPKLHFVFF